MITNSFTIAHHETRRRGADYDKPSRWSTVCRFCDGVGLALVVEYYVLRDYYLA